MGACVWYVCTCARVCPRMCVWCVSMCLVVCDGCMCVHMCVCGVYMCLVCVGCMCVVCVYVCMYVRCVHVPVWCVSVCDVCPCACAVCVCVHVSCVPRCAREFCTLRASTGLFPGDEGLTEGSCSWGASQNNQGPSPGIFFQRSFLVVQLCSWFLGVCLQGRKCGDRVRRLGGEGPLCPPGANLISPGPVRTRSGGPCQHVCARKGRSVNTHSITFTILTT